MRIKTVEEFDKYAISDDGKIFRKDELGVLRQLSTPGYPYNYAHLYNSLRKVAFHRSVGRLVATAFIGPSDGLQVNHRNGNKRDDRVENLEWVTPLQNIRHSIETGLVDMEARRERMRRCPRITHLNPEAVKVIRFMGGRVHYKTLAGLFGIAPSYVHGITMRRTWKHVA